MKNHDRPTSSRPIRVGVYATVGRADQAVSTLRGLGFGPEDISVICPEPLQAHFKDLDVEDRAGEHTTDAAVAGGAIGALIGGVGATAVVAATGGVGLFVVGPMVSGLAAGAIAGGFVGAMATRGVETEIADYYDQALRHDKILVAVESDDAERLEAAERAFELAGAEPVALRKG